MWNITWHAGVLNCIQTYVSNELARLYLNELVRSNRTYDLKIY